MKDLGIRRGVGVYAFSEDDTRVLMLQRGPLARHERYKWEAPGGQLESDETYKQAAVREFREELGVEVELGARIGEYKWIVDANSDEWDTQIFRGRISGTPTVQEPGKCLGFGWFTQAEVIAMQPANMLADYVIKDFQAIGWL